MLYFENKPTAQQGSRKYFLSWNQINCVCQNARISAKTDNAPIIQISIYHRILVSLRYGILDCASQCLIITIILYKERNHEQFSPKQNASVV